MNYLRKIAAAVLLGGLLSVTALAEGWMGTGKDQPFALTTNPTPTSSPSTAPNNFSTFDQFIVTALSVLQTIPR